MQEKVRKLQAAATAGGKDLQDAKAAAAESAAEAKRVAVGIAPDKTCPACSHIADAFILEGGLMVHIWPAHPKLSWKGALTKFFG